MVTVSSEKTKLSCYLRGIDPILHPYVILEGLIKEKADMRDRQRDPAADSRVMMDRQIHQPAADPLLSRPANTNVDPVIPRSTTTGNVDLYPSIKGQDHQELFHDPANYQPSLAHLSALSQHQQVPNTSQTIHTLPTANYP